MNKPHGKNAFMFVLVAVFIDMVGFGLIMPVMPDLLSELTQSPVEEAVKWVGPLSGIYALMNFIFGPILGNLSDRYGRRPVLLASIATLGLDFLVMALAQNIWVLFFARALSGISGATYSTAAAYIADVTEPEDRGRAFGMIGAAFGLGFIIGPVIGGLVGEIDPRAPFYVAAGMSFLNFLYGLFVLPESLPAEERRGFSIKRANPFGVFRHFSGLPHIYWMFGALFLYQVAHTVFPATWGYYGEIRYDWTSRDIGLSLGFMGLVTAIVQGGLTGRVIKMFGPEKTVWIGLTINVLGCAAFAFAGQAWMVYMILPFSSLGGLFGPSYNMLTANRTPRNAQGELQGANASVQSLGQVVSPFIMAYTLSYFSSPNAPVYFPGAAFLLAAVLIALAAGPLRFGLRAGRRFDAATAEPSEDRGAEASDKTPA